MYFECVDCGHRQSYYRRHCPCCWSTLIVKVTPIPAPAERAMINTMEMVIAAIERKVEAKTK